MLKLNRLLVVMSVERSGLTQQDNEQATSRFKTWLTECEYPYDEAVGYYKGAQENSFVIQCLDFSDVGRLQEEAALAGQECIMIVDARSKAFLYYPDKCKLDYIGLMYSFNKELDAGRAIPEACTIVGDEVYYAI